MYYINFSVGQCRRQFEACLCNDAIHNFCSTKSADEFQRILNIDKIPIEPCVITTANGTKYISSHKIIVPVNFFYTNGKGERSKSISISLHV